LYSQAVQGCRWLVPQDTPEGYRHSYWTYVLKLENDGEFSWYDFRKKYLELGGNGIYAAWQLTYLEPTLRKNYRAGLCPIAESVQPRLLQFKTNYMDLAVAGQKAETLENTIAYFGK